MRGAHSPGRGVLFGVGLGPGDPELLTLKAVRLLRAATVVAYDKLVGGAILEFIHPDAERIYVGKSKACHAKSQDQINALLVERALAGHVVVRLKGGDPFIFGRGGEEVETLRAHGVAVEIVPGVTAASGCAAATSIPLTHRDHAQAVTFVTGHAKDGVPDLDWPSLAKPNQTVVVYMGVSTAAVIAASLLDHGLDPKTPVAVVENGTRADQKVAIGTVAGLSRLIAWNDITGPAVLIVGTVVETARAALPAIAAQAAAG